MSKLDLVKKVGKDLNLESAVMDSILSKDPAAAAESIAIIAFILDKNMDSVRKLRNLLYSDWNGNCLTKR